MKKLIRAVGIVHRETAVPVLCHTEMGTACHELLDLLEAAGVPPHRVILSHVDRNPDCNMHQQWAKRGAFLQYDTPGRIKYQSEHLVIDLMRRLFNAGLGSQLLLGGDMARRSYWKAYGGGPGFDYLLTTFTRRLIHEGFTEGEVDIIWQHNPQRWLAPDC
jgi:phosphotriesterase-related protein